MTRTVSTPPTDAPATSGDARSALGWMHTARFLTTAAQLHQLPAVDVPEIAVMQGFASMLEEQDMKNIAAWLATKPAKPGEATDKALVALGERIYRGGIADRNIAACAACHSPNGAGIPAQYPRLAGQHAVYTETQLKAFRDGVRKNNLQMTGVAAKLNDREIKAVADYIAGLR